MKKVYFFLLVLTLGYKVLHCIYFHSQLPHFAYLFAK